MRFGLSLLRGLAAISICSAVAGACSAGGDGKGGKGPNGGNTAGNGSGGTIPILDGAVGGSTMIDPGTGGTSTTPTLNKCTKTTDCGTGEVCVLTPNGGLCSPNGGDCSDPNTKCQNDTFCCAPTDGCNIEGVTTPTCVSNIARPVNEMCKTNGTVGLFSPDLQCEWTKPDDGDPFPEMIHVLTTPLVANLPTESGTAGEIIIVTSNGKADASEGGRIRILNGQTCKQIEVIGAGAPVRDAATPAIADLDGDGKMEIVARLNGQSGGADGGLIAFKFNGTKYDVMWTAAITGATGEARDGVSIHDLDNDGIPEIIGRGGQVNNGMTGAVIAASNPAIILSSDPAVGDVDGDGKVELVANKVFRWMGNAWAEAYPGIGATAAAQSPSFFAFADFGTRSGAGQFDATKPDGRAEVVGVGPLGGDGSTGTVKIYTLEGDALLNITMPARTACNGGREFGERGGPPTIGDFDGDGMPELASAGAYAYRVFDLGCAAAGNCKDAARSILWESPTQDCSSGTTGSTIFDFEGDGQAEAIYADECFVRVYNGKTGDVLFSTYRNSATWVEQPVVADPDNSDRSKIIFGGAPLFNVYSGCGNPQVASNCESTGRNTLGCVDPLWAGVKCAQNDECVSGSCVEGFCRCTTDAECGNNWMATAQNPNDQLSGLACHNALPGTPGAGKVCRMEFGNITTIAEANKWFAGVKVYRDKLDRWASSRNLWNQHAYSITNINDDGKIPKTSEWVQNFKTPGMNNFRQNRQGATSQELADITGALSAATACQLTMDNQVIFNGRICNRGLRGVGSNMPAAFYLGDDRTMPLCTTQTPGPVPKGECQNIECTIPKADVPTNSVITMIVNDVGGGNRLVDECNYENNVAQVTVEKCNVVK